MISIKKFIVLVGFVLIGVACAPVAQPAAQPPAAPQATAATQATAAPQATTAAAGGEKSALSMWYFNWPPGYEYQDKRVKEYMQQHPEVTINFDHSVPPTGEGGFEDKVTAALATGTGPDIFAVINPQAIKLIDKGQLAPIDAAAAKALGYDSVDALKASRYPGAFASWSDANGTPYGYHWELSWLQLYCNDEHLKAAGIDPDKVDIKTWDDLIALGKQVIEKNPSFYKDSSGKFVKNFIKFPMYYDDTWSMQVLTAFLAQAGGSVLNPDKTAAAINSPEGIKALETMMKVSRELGDPNVGPTEPGAIHTAFGSGEQTCDLAGPWMNIAFLKANNSPVLGKYHVYGMPSIEAGKPGNVFWGWAWVVNAQSQNKDAAWKFLRFLEDDPQGQALASGIWQPVPGIEGGQVGKEVPYAQAIADSAKGAQAIFVTDKYAEIARLLRGKIESMAFSGADVKTSADEAAGEINNILKQ